MNAPASFEARGDSPARPDRGASFDARGDSPARPIWRSRAHPSWIAFLLHRLSGLALAAFIPLHFWALGQIHAGEAALDQVLAWSAHPLVKLAETALVIALALHLAGGLRLLAVEFALWRGPQGAAVAGAIGLALAAGLSFLLNAAG